MITQERLADAQMRLNDSFDSLSEKIIRLRAAADEAREVIQRYRDEIVECDCLYDPEGHPMHETMEPETRIEVAKLDDLILRLS